MLLLSTKVIILFQIEIISTGNIINNSRNYCFLFLTQSPHEPGHSNPGCARDKLNTMYWGPRMR